MDESTNIEQASTVHDAPPSTDDIIADQPSVSDGPPNLLNRSTSELLSFAIQGWEIPAHVNSMPTSFLLTALDLILDGITTIEALLQRKVTHFNKLKNLLPTMGARMASLPPERVPDSTLEEYQTLLEEFEEMRAEMKDEKLAEINEKIAKLVATAQQWVLEVQRRLSVARAEMDGEAVRMIEDWRQKW